MKTKLVLSCAVALALGIGNLSLPNVALAGGFSPMDAMNPSKWFGGKKKDRYYDDYDYGPPPGYGAPYGPGWGGYPGYGGAPGYGYGGAPGYGYGGAPGYGYGAPAYGAPGVAPGYGRPGYGQQAGPSTSELQDRIEKLEVEQQRKAYQTPPPAPSGDAGGATPGGFRPFSPDEPDYSSGFQPAYGSNTQPQPQTQPQAPQLWR